MLLKALTEAFGPSGFEDEVRHLLREEVIPLADRVSTDALGSLIVEKNPDAEGSRVLFAAHMDEVGLMVVGIEDNGLLRFRPLGGVDPRILVAKPVRIGAERRYGVIGAKAIHLQQPEERTKPFEMQQLLIDIGANTREEAERLVEIGDPVVFATEYEEFGDRRAKAKSFDDRVGCAVLVELLKQPTTLPLTVAFTVQEETGLRGAGPVAYRTKPDLAMVVEGTVCFDVGEAKSHEQSTAQGAGPALSVVDGKTIANTKFREFIKSVADEEAIPWQYRRTVGGANDAGVIHLSEMGILTAAVSIPTRYIHAPAQVIHLDDYHNTIRLLSAVIERIEKGGHPIS